MIGQLGFLSPWMLVALAALPLIWLILRLTPPRPRLIAFPPTRLLFELKDREPTQPTIGNESVADGILNLYKTDPHLQILFELMTDFDEGFQEWRYRHIKLVERTIGSKQGTGGSLGVEFLKRSLFQPIFPDLWAIRHRL